MNRPYETTKASGSINNGGSKPPPYGKTVRLMFPDVILSEVSIVVIFSEAKNLARMHGQFV